MAESKDNSLGTRECKFKEALPGCSICYCNSSGRENCKYRGKTYPYINPSSPSEWSRKATCELSSIL